MTIIYYKIISPNYQRSFQNSFRVKSSLAIWDKFDKWVILRNTQNQEIKQIKPYFPVSEIQ